MQDTGSTLATYKRLFIPNPFSSDEENEAKKSAQQQEEDAGNAIKDFMTGVWDSLAGTVWENPIALQHPLAVSEIVVWDGSLILVISKKSEVVNALIENNTFAQDLEKYNME